SPGFTNMPTVLAPGQTATGAILTWTNDGPDAAAGAICVATVDEGTISNVVCTPPTPATVAVNGSIVCTFDYTAPGTPGGTDSVPTGVIFTGTTGATNDTNAGNNTTTVSAPILDALDDDYS